MYSSFEFTIPNATVKEPIHDLVQKTVQYWLYKERIGQAIGNISRGEMDTIWILNQSQEMKRKLKSRHWIVSEEVKLDCIDFIKAKTALGISP